MDLYCEDSYLFSMKRLQVLVIPALTVIQLYRSIFPSSEYILGSKWLSIRFLSFALVGSLCRSFGAPVTSSDTEIYGPVSTVHLSKLSQCRLMGVPTCNCRQA